MFCSQDNASKMKLGCTVSPDYNSASNLEVIFRLNASVWKRVLPWCITNTLIAAAIQYNEFHFGNLFSTTDKGHAFMSLSVSYLLVTRVNQTLNRYMTQRTQMGTTMRCAKEIVVHAATYSRSRQEECDKRWRKSIAKRTISLMKCIVAVMRYPTSKQHIWELDDLEEEEQLAMNLVCGESDERSPLVLVLFLRTIILSHIHKLSKPLEVQHELQLMQYTTDLMAGYSQVMKFMTTPYPFPLVQMTRTILFFYIFTLPCALNTDIKEAIPYLLTVFMITYGFIGSELICIELEDPFGNDPNDFDVKAMASMLYKDIALFIKDSDGEEAEKEIVVFTTTKLDKVIKSTVKNHGKQFSRVPEWIVSQSSSSFGDSMRDSVIVMNGASPSKFPIDDTVRSLRNLNEEVDNTSDLSDYDDDGAKITSSGRSRPPRPPPMHQRSITLDEKESTILKTVRNRNRQDDSEYSGNSNNVNQVLSNLTEESEVIEEWHPGRETPPPPPPQSEEVLDHDLSVTSSPGGDKKDDLLSIGSDEAHDLGPSLLGEDILDNIPEVSSLAVSEGEKKRRLFGKFKNIKRMISPRSRDRKSM